MNRSVDYHFAKAIRRAGAAFQAAKRKDPTIEGSDLAELLLSGAHIGQGEREMLAELVTGRWRRMAGEAGKAREIHPESDIVTRIVSALREKVSNGVKKEAAKASVAEEFEVHRGTVERYEKMVVERENAVANGKNNTLP